MLTRHCKPVCLSLMAFDMPIWSALETTATLYQRDTDRFHLLLTEPLIQEMPDLTEEAEQMPDTPRLLWLEFSPHRVVMTMQGNGRFSYRHVWQRGVYGISRYWLQGEAATSSEQVQLQNYTRSLDLKGESGSDGFSPHHLRLEYELWSGRVRLGHYVLNLDIQP